MLSTLFSLERRKRRRRQKAAVHVLVDGPVALAVRPGLDPLLVGQEGVPLLLALRHALPLQHVGQVVAVGAEHGGEEADLLDGVALPDRERVVLEAREEVRQPAGQGGVDAEFDDHGFFGGGVDFSVLKYMFFLGSWVIDQISFPVGFFGGLRSEQKKSEKGEKTGLASAKIVYLHRSSQHFSNIRARGTFSLSTPPLLGSSPFSLTAS